MQTAGRGRQRRQQQQFYGGYEVRGRTSLKKKKRPATCAAVYVGRLSTCTILLCCAERGSPACARHEQRVNADCCHYCDGWPAAQVCFSTRFWEGIDKSPTAAETHTPAVAVVGIFPDVTGDRRLPCIAQQIYTCSAGREALIRTSSTALRQPRCPPFFPPSICPFHLYVQLPQPCLERPHQCQPLIARHVLSLHLIIGGLLLFLIIEKSHVVVAVVVAAVLSLGEGYGICCYTLRPDLSRTHAPGRVEREIDRCKRSRGAKRE